MRNEKFLSLFSFLFLFLLLLYRCDVCAVCNSWDYHHAKPLQQDWDEAYALLADKCLGFWGDKELPCVVDEEPNGTTLKTFTKLVHEHDRVCHANCPAKIDAATVLLHMKEKWEKIITVFDFHFALKEQVRDAFQRQLNAPPEGFTGVVMDFQELGTLPVGPDEVGDLWYANNRLGYTTFTAMVWGRATGGKNTSSLMCPVSSSAQRRSRSPSSRIW